MMVLELCVLELKTVVRYFFLFFFSERQIGYIDLIKAIRKSKEHIDMEKIGANIGSLVMIWVMFYK